MTTEQENRAKQFIELLQVELNGKQLEFFHSDSSKMDISLVEEFVPSIQYLQACRVKPEPQYLYEILVKRFDDESLTDSIEYATRSNDKKQSMADLFKLKVEYADDPTFKVIMNIYKLVEEENTENV